MKATTASPTPKNKGGRPTLRTASLDAKVFYLARRGFTDQETCDLLGLSYNTFTTHWKRKDDFLNQLNTAKAEADELVERSLYERALGYTYTTQELLRRKSGDDELVDVEHRLPPDVTACIIWLKHRRPKLWGDRDPSAFDGSEKPPRVVFMVNVHGVPQVPAAPAPNGHAR